MNFLIMKRMKTVQPITKSKQKTTITPAGNIMDWLVGKDWLVLGITEGPTKPKATTRRRDDAERNRRREERETVKSQRALGALQ